jgi:hypothetical protein
LADGFCVVLALINSIAIVDRIDWWRDRAARPSNPFRLFVSGARLGRREALGAAAVATSSR